jgi:hypothetical protein
MPQRECKHVSTGSLNESWNFEQIQNARVKSTQQKMGKLHEIIQIFLNQTKKSVSPKTDFAQRLGLFLKK